MAEQARVGEHHRRPERVAERRGLGHSSIGSASSSTRPPPRTQWSSATRSSAGCARGCAISSSRPFASSAESVDADRDDPVASPAALSCRRAGSLQGKIIAEHQRQAGQEQQRRALTPAPRRHGAAATRANPGGRGDRRSGKTERAPARDRSSLLGRAVVASCPARRARRRARPAARSARWPRACCAVLADRRGSSG